MSSAGVSILSATWLLLLLLPLVLPVFPFVPWRWVFVTPAAEVGKLPVDEAEKVAVEEKDDVEMLEVDDEPWVK